MKLWIFPLIIFVASACGAPEQDQISSICAMNSFASNSSEECICKLNILKQNFGRPALEELSAALEEDDLARFESKMISLAVENPSKAAAVSEAQARECS